MTSVNISQTIKTLKVNEEFSLEVEVNPQSQKEKMKFSVTPNDVVEVDEVGKITALKQGIATVKVSVDDKSDTITINVTEE